MDKLEFYKAHVKILGTYNCDKKQREPFKILTSNNYVETGEYFVGIFTATFYN